MAAARPTAARVKVTPFQISVLQAVHAHPAATTASDLADLMGDAGTWSVCEAIGSMLVDGLVVHHGGYDLTEAGAASIGVEYSPRGIKPTAPDQARGQLGLFGGLL